MSSPCCRWRNCGTCSPASAGLISVGQQAFVGLGAYALFAFTVIAGLDAVLSIVLSGALAGLVAIPAALIVFRLRGAYFAIGTWVVAEVCRLVLAQVKQLGGGTGTSLPPDIASSIVGLDSVRDFFAVRGPAARDIDGLLAGARCSRSARSRWSIGCCARATAWRCPPSAIPRPPPRASASTSSAPNS